MLDILQMKFILIFYQTRSQLNGSTSNYYAIEDNVCVTVRLDGCIHSSYYHRRITIGSSMHPRADIGTRYAETNESLGTLGVTSSQPIYLPVIRCQTL